MRSVGWSPSLAVSVPEIDAEHQELIRLTAELRRVVDSRARMKRVESVFHELAAHTAAHFAHEERYMKLTRYSQRAWHFRQHAAATRNLMKLGRQIRRGDREAAAQLIDFVTEWLPSHIGLSDRMLGAHLRNYERAKNAKAS